MTTTAKIIGLIPAAGRATRMGNLPFSKELLPLANASPIPKQQDGSPDVAIDHALTTFSEAGINDACIVIAPGKWDIPTHIGDGERFDQSIAYILADASPNVPTSLDKAWFLTRDREVALLFPDIVFKPKQALKEIVDHRRKTDDDLVLALVPAASGEKIDIVVMDENGMVETVTPKPGESFSGLTWVAATWNAKFSQHLHIMLSEPNEHSQREMYVADVINAAIDAGLTISALSFLSGKSFDLGTPGELFEFWESAKVSP